MLSKESLGFLFVVSLFKRIFFCAFSCKRAVLGHGLNLCDIYVITELLCHKRVFLIVSGNVRLGQRIVKIEIAVHTVRIGHSIGKIKIVVNSHRAYLGHSAARKRKLVKLLCAGGIHLCKVVELLLGSRVLILRLGLFRLLMLSSACTGGVHILINFRGIQIHNSAHSERHSNGIRCEIYVIIEVIVVMMLYLVCKNRELFLLLLLENGFFSRSHSSVCSVT